MQSHRLIGALVTGASSMVLTLGVPASPAAAQTTGPGAGPKVVTPPVISTAAGTGAAGFSGDGGPATSAKVSYPSGMAEDIAGSLYLADTANNRIRRIRGGTMTTVAGNGSPGFSGDGGQARSAKLSGPTGVAVDAGGNLYIADSNNGRIRKVSSAGIISTIAGNGKGTLQCGSGGDGGPATKARLCLPTSVALDSGNLYIADTGNNEIRQVNGIGIITAAAGSGRYGSSGDNGPATKAKLANPTAVALDGLHNLYIGDSGNFKVRKVTAATGTISTFAGTGSYGYSGDGNKAVLGKMTTPSGLGVDPLGNVYIADTFNNRIRVVIPKGDIVTYAGNGVAGYSGDGGPAQLAMLNRPSGNIAVDANDIYFADTANNRARGVHGGPPPDILETPFIALLPISAAALLGAGYVIARRAADPPDCPTSAQPS